MSDYYGYIHPRDGRSREDTEVRCDAIANGLNGKIKEWIIEEHPETGKTLHDLVMSGTLKPRHSVIFTENPDFIVGSFELCHALHLRFVEMISIRDMVPYRKQDDFIDVFWHHVNSNHRRIKGRIVSHYNATNESRQKDAEIRRVELLNDVDFVRRNTKHRSQHAIACYLIENVDRYKVLGDESGKGAELLQKRISVAQNYIKKQKLLKDGDRENAPVAEES